MLNLIDEIFTTKLTELLAQGYTVATASMNGSQGELAKMHFLKDDQLFVLWADNKSHWGSTKEPWWDTTEIKFGRLTDEYVPGCTVWLSQLEVIDSISVYHYGDYTDRAGQRGARLTLDKAEISEAWMKSHNRDLAKWGKSEEEVYGYTHTDDAAITAAYRLLKKRDGYKMLRKHNVVAVHFKDRYSLNRILVEVRNTSVHAAFGSTRTVEIFRTKKAA